MEFNLPVVTPSCPSSSYCFIDSVILVFAIDPRFCSLANANNVTTSAISTKINKPRTTLNAIKRHLFSCIAPTSPRINLVS